MRVHRSPLALLLLVSLALLLTFATVSWPAAAKPTESIIYKFMGGTDGLGPEGLVVDSSGNLFGTTYYGGSSNLCFWGCGQVYELKPPASGGPWTRIVIHNFVGNPSDGYNPGPDLTFDSAGNLYGTTSFGGQTNAGIIYKLARPAVEGATWQETILFNFSFANHGINGFTPGSVAVGPSGKFYGTTYGGGPYDGGTFFQLAPQGGQLVETVLHVFGRSLGDSPPQHSLTYGPDGALYGTRSGLMRCIYNPIDCGNVYRLRPPKKQGGQAAYTVLHKFQGNDSWFPNAQLVFDASGNLYGTTFAGGSYTAGIAFQLVPQNGSWIEYAIHYFGSGSGDGIEPFGGMSFDAHGNLYGTTSTGGPALAGVIYKLSNPGHIGASWPETTLYDFLGGTNVGSYPNDQPIFGKDGALYGTTYMGGLNNCSNNSMNGCGTIFRLVP
jgi:uncharacterized repeat protein (TIGR03803 family)